MAELTNRIADAFIRHLSRRVHARVIRKSMAIEMELVASALEVARSLGAEVPSAGDFLNNYATSVGPLVYLPDNLSPQDAVITFTHEAQHVIQFWRHGLDMFWLYLTEPEARVRYEAEAYRAGLEVATALGLPLPSLQDLAWPLEAGYALDEGAKKLGRQLLEVAATSVSSGIVSTEAGTMAVDYLRALRVV